ncbi:hypothetical protein D3C85_1801260 [compost metagenome]
MSMKATENGLPLRLARMNCSSSTSSPLRREKAPVSGSRTACCTSAIMNASWQTPASAATPAINPCSQNAPQNDGQSTTENWK